MPEEIDGVQKIKMAEGGGLEPDAVSRTPRPPSPRCITWIQSPPTIQCQINIDWCKRKWLYPYSLFFVKKISRGDVISIRPG